MNLKLLNVVGAVLIKDKQIILTKRDKREIQKE